MLPDTRDATVFQLISGENMIRVRSSLAIRVLIILIGLFTTISMFHTHVLLHKHKHHAAYRSLINDGSLPTHYNNQTTSKRDIVETPLPRVNVSNHLPQSNGSTVKAGTPAKAAETKINYVLPRNRYLPNLREDLAAEDSHARTVSLEEEHFILVHPKHVKTRNTKKEKTATRESRSWEQKQKERRKHLRDVCRRRPELHANLSQIIIEEPSKLWPFLVSDRLKLVFSVVPMTASSFWQTAFQKALQRPPARQRSARDFVGANVRNLSSYEPWEIKHRLQNYTKMIFVRDPFARVLSAYRRKFLPSSSKHNELYGPLIVQKYRQDPPAVSSNMSHVNLNVTFGEFANFIDEFSDEIVDSHWDPMSKSVLPCEIDYDFIGKMEEGPKEFDAMLRSAKMKWLIKYKPSIFKTSSHNGAVYDHYFNQLLPSQIKKLHNMYEADFALFGYPSPTLKRPS